MSNRHGVFLRISQVWATNRSAITIPGRSIDKFREIINELADHMSTIMVFYVITLLLLHYFDLIGG